MISALFKSAKAKISYKKVRMLLTQPWRLPDAVCVVRVKSITVLKCNDLHIKRRCLCNKDLLKIYRNGTAGTTAKWCTGFISMTAMIVITCNINN